ncbi:Hypothetical_protein [Hexamita inflata]|uniref:Hypothetical_protein n=1 Tax=Hexamita inflata TaxID=28002 RepID=A0AA86NJ82_9EUKA|nr:Hypothetical protein HINF_LOCUS8574 [Hexamita inflata]
MNTYSNGIALISIFKLWLKYLKILQNDINTQISQTVSNLKNIKYIKLKQRLIQFAPELKHPQLDSRSEISQMEIDSRNSKTIPSTPANPGLGKGRVIVYQQF